MVLIEDFFYMRVATLKAIYNFKVLSFLFEVIKMLKKI
jgi:hypothetical protein